MIIGLCARDPRCPVVPQAVWDAFGYPPPGGDALVADCVVAGWYPNNVAAIDRPGRFAQDAAGRMALVEGNLFNREEFGPLGDAGDAALLLTCTATDDSREQLARIDGSFAGIMWDPVRRTLSLVRDQLGIETLYYVETPDAWLFATSLHDLLRHPDVTRRVDPLALSRYLLFHYNPTSDSLVQGVKKVPPGHCLVMDADRRVRLIRYWRLSFAEPWGDRSEAVHGAEIRERLARSIRQRLPASGLRVGVFLSGGMDSSSVVSLLGPMLGPGAVHTYSFRCQGKSCDESSYARLMSEALGTEHHQVEFPPEEVTQVAEMAAAMEEPFADVGIEIAWWLLGRAAAGNIDCVFTGDGGDELFGGHPVYLADRVARHFDRLPALLRGPIANVFQLLPDTEEKKSLAVKLKRFAYGSQFPASLYSNRWRMYYGRSELCRLGQPDWLENLNGIDPAEPIAALYAEADGPDQLSRALYGDYFTVVDFYLRRAQMLRHFGLEARLPMLAPRLVEYAARLPSSLKIRNGRQTKYILHRAMQGVVPPAILYRKDKLGHTVPLKNWLRSSDALRDLVAEVLSPQTLRQRGLFEPRVVQQMLAEHRQKRQNHSHRLWALVVLELWMQHHLSVETRAPSLSKEPRR